MVLSLTPVTVRRSLRDRILATFPHPGKPRCAAHWLAVRSQCWSNPAVPGVLASSGVGLKHSEVWPAEFGRTRIPSPPDHNH
jgi:hypothetical protein